MSPIRPIIRSSNAALATAIALVLTLLLAAVVGVPGAGTPALAATAGTPDPTAGVPTPKAVRVAHVGRSAAGIPIGISIGTDGTAVAYLCDGSGKVGTWFTGTLDAKARSVSLKSSGGDTIRYDAFTRRGTLTLGTASTPLRLELATGIAGIYRNTGTEGGRAAVAGWVITNDGRLTGQATLDGKVVVAAAESLSAPLEPLPTTPSTIPVAVQTASGFRCNVLEFRIGFTQFTGATLAFERVHDRAERLGCLATPTPSS